MNETQWERLRELFETARVLAPNQQAEFCDSACGDDETLKSELQQLLHAHRTDADQRFDTPLHVSDHSDRDPIIGSEIGRYRIQRFLGSGGFGVVYAAVRQVDYTQKVAVKILHATHTNQDSIRRRFEVERQLLADLNHPGIARLLDGGVTADGRPYLVMELVRGLRIDEYFRPFHDLRQRLRIVRSVCDALAYAHRDGVVHRDIKPANILVRADGQPKLIDFGIAKLTDLRSQAESLTLTREGLLPFTPRYASPEQVQGHPVTPASDVYSLGAVLYELVAGRSAFDATGLAGEVRPTAPSRVAKKSEDADATNSVAPNTKIDRELDNIILKALHEDPARRYADAAAIGEDIDRYLRGEPVTAQRDSIFYLSSKYVRKHRWTVMAMTVAIVAIVFAITNSLVQRQAASQADQERIVFQQQRKLERHADEMQRAFEANEGLDIPTVREVLRGDQLDRQTLEWQVLNAVTRPMEPKLLQHRGSVHEVAVVPGKPWIISAGDDRDILIWNSDSGQLVRKLGTAQGPVHSLAITADGKTLAVGREQPGDGDGDVELWSLETFTSLGIACKCTYVPESLAFSHHGKRLAVGCRYDELFMVDVESRTVQATTITGARYLDLHFLRDGRLLAPVRHDKWVNGRKHFIATFDQNLNELSRFNQVHAGPFAVSIDETRIVLASSDAGRVILMDLENAIELTRNQGNESGIASVAISDNNASVAVGYSDGTISIWDVVHERQGSDVKYSLAERVRMTGDRQSIARVILTNKGRLVSSGREPHAKVWPLRWAGSKQDVVPPRELGVAAVFSRDGSAAVQEAEGRLWLQPPDGDWIELTPNNNQERSVLAVGRHAQIAIYEQPHTLILIRREKRLPLPAGLQLPAGLRGAAFSQDGKLLAVGFGETVQVWHLETGQRLANIEFTAEPLAIVFSPKAGSLLWGLSDGAVGIYDLATRARRRFHASTSAVRAIACTADETQLATTHDNGEVWLYPLADNAPPVLIDKSARTFAVEFSPDSKTIVVGAGRRIQFWQLPSRRKLGGISIEHRIHSLHLNPGATKLRYFEFDQHGTDGLKTIDLKPTQTN